MEKEKGGSYSVCWNYYTGYVPLNVEHLARLDAAFRIEKGIRFETDPQFFFFFVLLPRERLIKLPENRGICGNSFNCFLTFYYCISV